ncbi:MAG: hypothetical protein GY867_09090 [bacterium]|nr:hypothetical protein [bacterium]
MKTRLGLFPLLTLAITLLACGGPKRAVRQGLYFVDNAKQDTAYFVHLRPEGQPFSIEILGTCKEVSDSTYLYQLQVGTYEHPGFIGENYVVRPEKTALSINGVEPRSRHDLGSFEVHNKWVALSLHWFVFDRAALSNSAGDGFPLKLDLHLDGYAEYDGKPVPLQDVVILDRWFRLPQQEL